ncbi:MAG: hypothetical protein O7D91_01585 [Planctomycetota bacterium]|nr:hypothetical protein [Planctomycetota bacterium]
MMSKTKQKLYGTIMIVAAAAFAVDHWVIGSPKAADAVPIESETLEPTLLAKVNPSEPSYDMPRQFPENLPSMDWSRPMPNPFEPPPEVARRNSAPNTGDRDAETAPLRRRPGEPPRIAEFIEAHRLSGVFVGRSAIVDGHVVRIGQKVDDAELLRVEGNEAHFQCSDGQATLSLARRSN